MLPLFSRRFNEEQAYILKIVVSMIPIGIVGFLFKEQINALLDAPWILAFVGAMLLLTANGVSACNIGDSKIFRLSAGSLYQISEDHLSIAPYGEKAPLSQYLGIPPEELTICPYYAELPYADQDKYLLCSDGLTDMVPPEDIARILAKFPAEQAAQILLQNALDNGGKDNVTLIVLEIGRPATTGLLDRIRNLF